MPSLLDQGHLNDTKKKPGYSQKTVEVERHDTNSETYYEVSIMCAMIGSFIIILRADIFV